MVTPQVFWLHDNQDKNVVAWVMMPVLIDAGEFCLPAARQSG